MCFLFPPPTVHLEGELCPTAPSISTQRRLGRLQAEDQHLSIYISSPIWN